MSSKGIMEFDGEVSDITTSGFQYDVFLNFRGVDTRLGFVDHLYHALNDVEIKTYRDDEELTKGEKLGSQLLKAIKESKIAIPIFSKNYAASAWCLKELAQIVEYKRSNRLQVMPIFYDVTPSEVRNQTGDYAYALEKHKNRYDENTIESWKAALKEVGRLSGWALHSRSVETEGNLIKEIKEVVKAVLRKLKKAYLTVTYYLVGIQAHVEAILRKLSDDSSDVGIVGIFGMAGIGKTTLAKVIYNRLLCNFESHSFLADIRETYRIEGMEFLCKRLISDILGTELANISNVDEGIRIIKERFSNKKVLIVLDDVDEISQLDLITNRDWFGCGSRIIITTRNRSILHFAKVDWSYELRGLTPNLSLQLFSKHAFQEDRPPKEYLELSQKVVSMTGGIPLTLEVLGSSLCGKRSEEWHPIVEKLQSVSNQDFGRTPEISFEALDGKEKQIFLENDRRRLKIVFEALDDKQKKIFLDIAWFFLEEDYRLLIHFWEDPKEAMEVLQEKSLVKLRGNKLRMHDQLRKLGKEIVQKEHTERGTKCWLWDTKETMELFMGNKGNENVHAIRFNMGERSGHHFSSGKFANLPNLRLLHMEYDSPHLYDPVIVEAKNFKVFSKGCLCRGHPPIFSELRWLSLHWFLGMRMTKNITFQKLAILDLSHSGIKRSWSGWSHMKVARNLKVLNLTGCWQLVKTPDFSCHPNLEQLILEDCWELVEIDKSISKLEKLVIINLRGCRRLKKLPRELSCQESLEELIISFTSIREIPSWPLMTRLKVFKSFSCYDLKMVSSLAFAVNITELSLASSKIAILPDSIGKLEKLLKLSLKWCEGMKRLPESIGDLESLVELDLKSSGIIELPNTIGTLRNLKTMTISSTPLKTLPPAIGDLESLVELDLKSSGIIELPNTIGTLRNLKTMTISSTPLKTLPPEIRMMENLTSIKACNCSDLHDIPELPPRCVISL